MVLSRSPAIWALCKGISVAGDAKAIARFEPLCKVISVIHDGKSVARFGALCKEISVTCNAKTQRLFWAFRDSCVYKFQFRSDKKIRVWRWVAVMLSRDSTPPHPSGRRRAAVQPRSNGVYGSMGFPLLEG